MIRSAAGNLSASSPWLGTRMTPAVRQSVRFANTSLGPQLSPRPMPSGSRQSFTYFAP